MLVFCYSPRDYPDGWTTEQSINNAHGLLPCSREDKRSFARSTMVDAVYTEVRVIDFRFVSAPWLNINLPIMYCLLVYLSIKIKCHCFFLLLHQLDISTANFLQRFSAFENIICTVFSLLATFQLRGLLSAKIICGASK